MNWPPSRALKVSCHRLWTRFSGSFALQMVTYLSKAEKSSPDCSSFGFKYSENLIRFNRQFRISLKELLQLLALWVLLVHCSSIHVPASGQCWQRYSHILTNLSIIRSKSCCLRRRPVGYCLLYRMYLLWTRPSLSFVCCKNVMKPLVLLWLGLLGKGGGVWVPEPPKIRIQLIVSKGKSQ